MKIMFLYPALISGWGSYREHGNNESSYMDHGFAMISAVLKTAGHETFSVDLRSFRDWHQFEQTIKELKFDMTLVSFFSANERFAAQAVEIVKRNHPSKIIVGGGVHLSVTKTRKYINIDSIVLGEGEPHILNIVNSVERGEPLKDVYDLEMVENLDNLPYVDRNLFNPRMEQTSPLLQQLPEPFITIVAGRGCWGKCTFCAPSRNLISGNKIRIRSVDNFIGELTYLNRQLKGIGSIMIHDDLLGTKKWMEEFITKWKINLPGIPWWCQLRADTIIKMREFIPLLADIGLTYVSVGLESGSQRMLDFLQKGTTVEENIEACSILHESGINIFGNYITCLPTETKEDLDGTEKMLAAIRPAFHSASVYTSYPGSHLYDWIVKNDYWLTPEEHYSTTRYPYERKIKGIDYPEVMRRRAEWGSLYTSPLRIPKKITKTSVYIKDDYRYSIDRPIVSVITVTYNRPDKLKSAIQSIFGQSEKRWELIILDYTEDQNVNKDVREWAIQDNRVRWVSHTKNINNISYCWNEGLDLARGKYWCTLDDDNIKYPDHLSLTTKYLEDHPEKDSVVCPMDVVNNGAVSSTLFWKPSNFNDLLNFNKMDSGQLVHRKTLLEKIGYFDERLPSYDDWDFNLRIYNINGQSGSALGWLDGKSLCTYTNHPQQRTNDASIRNTWAQTIPFIKSKDRKERLKIKIANATVQVTESQKQFAENSIDAISSLAFVDLVHSSADIVILNGILFRFTQAELMQLKIENPQAQFVALLIEDPQAIHVNMENVKYADWLVTNDINAYEYYIKTVEEPKRKQVLLWNNLYISNKLLNFMHTYKPEKEYDVCLVGYPYQSRINFIRELMPMIKGKSLVLIGDTWKNHIKGAVTIHDTLNEIEAAKIAMKSRINIIKHRTNEESQFKVTLPGNINRGYIEAGYRSMLLIDNDRKIDSFDPNTVARYETAHDCAGKINEIISKYDTYANTINSLYEKATEQFTLRQVLLKVLNCVRSCRHNAKLS